MKKINIQLLIVAVACLFIGASLFAVIAYDYRDFKTLPPLPATKETVEILKQMYFSCEFKLLPCVAASVMIVGISLLIILRRTKN